MPTSGRSSSASESRESNGGSSSSCASGATHSSSSSLSEHSSSDDSERSASSYNSEAASSRSSSASCSRSSSSHEGNSRGREESGADRDNGMAPLKLPRLEGLDNTLHPSTSGLTTGRHFPSEVCGPSIFPAPPPSSSAVPLYDPVAPPPRYGPAFPPPAPFSAWAPPPPPPLPTLSAAAKDIAEMDVRAGVRLGVFRASLRLNKEQVMDEIESVRMTSSVERVLLESAQQLGLPGVPMEEREYAWATVFFADAEAAELCVARLCQPGRRSKWSRVCIQRLPIASLDALPLSPAEEQRYRVHAYQLESAVDTPGAASVTTSAVTDTVLARTAGGWCVLSTGGLLPTLGLATYLKHRRSGDFCSVEVCSGFNSDPEQDTCNAGGQCGRLHLREVEQWKLLLPVVLPAKASVQTSPHRKVVPAGMGATSTAGVALTTTLVETSWQKARHNDCLVLRPLPADIDESGFVYMFRGCNGFLRAQTVRTADQVRYGVVQFKDALSAQDAFQQATANTELTVRFYGLGEGDATVQLARATAVNHTAGNGGAAPQSTATAAPGVDATSAKAPKAVPDAKGNAKSASGIPETAAFSDDNAVTGSTHAPGVPFPPLPEGWEYGLSRRTMQYFFLQSGKKSTTWKHPVTQEQYKAKR
ncbi:hypothetical protein ABL78_0303 [Leptomonas seymouri]|uniref:WW domain-containing protein n=1 Tax=Leptomonas seymouri TaxID=5684 RepID=A0A0N1IC61_LEPSE|nr:hypothetical protein ABL78_0303 [Leptomonas seymouri]|eukprot:KPI90543.1 hypothetical protein ABL78_0303 [Leptomonas seymouri]